MTASRHLPKPLGPVARRIPPGEDRERLVCDSCGFINYVNPKIVVGSVALWEDRILLCRRAIEPRDGWWTLPAGYMERSEEHTSELQTLMRISYAVFCLK